MVRDRELEVALEIEKERTALSDARIWWIIIGCGLLYGGFGRVVFVLDKLAPLLGGATSISFLFLIPFAMGALVAFLGMTLTENTHLGRYASWWSERIMDEIQGNILGVIRQRAEAQSRSFQ